MINHKHVNKSAGSRVGGFTNEDQTIILDKREKLNT